MAAHRAALAKPLDTEPRQRVSRTNKLVETPLPRKVLFDRTNEAEDPNVEVRTSRCSAHA